MFKGYELEPLCVKREGFKGINQVRFVPKNKSIEVEVVYDLEVPDQIKDNGRYMGVDLGVDNLAVIANNYGENPIIINGKGLKAINAYYNKTLATLKSFAMSFNKVYTTKRIANLVNKRNRKIEDKMHKASRKLVEYAREQRVSVIVIGKNKDWKKKVNMGHVNNQNFVSIPFNTFIHMVEYKAEEYGIKVIQVDEKYTSGTSFLDDELPEKAYYKKSRRKTRGCFVSNKGIQINADVNAAYQMIKKVFMGSAYSKDVVNLIKGKALCPVVVNI